MEEIEAAIAGHTDVNSVAVRVWPDSSGSMSLAAYVVAPQQPDLRRFLQQKLPEYMIPARFVFMEALPLTPNGKVDRSCLPQPDPEQQRTLSRAPANEMERRLAAVWESVLDRKGIGVGDNFFDLGGHSLLVAKLLRRVEAEFGARLSMAAVFQAPTIQEFAELLNCKDVNVRTPKVSPIQGGGSRPPLFWMNAGPRYRALAARLGRDLPFLGVSIEAEEEESLPAQTTLQEIAAYMVGKIRAIRAHGPYQLGGLCVSGLLAYEVAAQLKASGEEVALVVMLDALNLHDFMACPARKILASRVRFHWKKIASGSFRQAWRHVAERFTDRFAKTSMESTVLWSEKLHQAALRYQPQAYAGRVLLVEPTERLDIAGLAESWAGIAQPRREIQPVNGDHISVLREPMVQELAVLIRRSVEEAGAPREQEWRPQIVNTGAASH